MEIGNQHNFIGAVLRGRCFLHLHTYSNQTRTESGITRVILSIGLVVSIDSCCPLLPSRCPTTGQVGTGSGKWIREKAWQGVLFCHVMGVPGPKPILRLTNEVVERPFKHPRAPGHRSDGETFDRVQSKSRDEAGEEPQSRVGRCSATPSVFGRGREEVMRDWNLTCDM